MSRNNPPKKPQEARKAGARFIILFFFLVLGFTFLVRSTIVDNNIILPYTKFITWISAKSFFLFGIDVEPVDTYMRHPDFSVDIRRGCDGVVATLILISACVAFPSPWIQKIKAVVYGYLLIFLLNIVRIFVLFSLGLMGWMKAFNFVHTYIAQFIVIACAMIFWIFWASRLKNSVQIAESTPSTGISD